MNIPSFFCCRFVVANEKEQEIKKEMVRVKERNRENFIQIE